MIDQTSIDRLETYQREGRLIRNAWTGTDEQCRATACLLAALVPDCGVAGDAGVCPASVLPPWLAHLTPWIDDAGTVEAWPGVVTRYVAILRAWNLDDAQSARCDYLCRALIVREARSHTTDARTVAACDTVIGLCDRAAAGDNPTSQEWAAARAAARAAASYAARDAAWAATAGAGFAAKAARAAARDAAGDAAWAAGAAGAAARAAAWAAGAAAWAAGAAARAAAGDAARAAAGDAAADRMIDGILTMLEAEIAHGPRGSK